MEDGDDAQEHRPEFDDGFVVGKGTEQRIGKEKEQYAHRRHRDGCQAVRFPVFQFCPYILPRADTLSDHRGCRDREAISWQERQGLDRQADLMRGVGHSAVQQDDLGVEDNPRLLKHPLAGDRRSNLPGGAQEITSYGE